MKRYLTGVLPLAAAFIISGCGNNSTSSGNGGDSSGTASTHSTTTIIHESNGIKLTALTTSPKYPGAEISLDNPPPGVDLAEGKNKFSFGVKNFTLGEQTADGGKNGLANSDHGQHIHMLLNNSPYMAHYNGEVEQEMAPGHYVLLGFLSRSYHESVKEPGAYVIRQFVVGNPESFTNADLSAPHLFYSRPKGDYKPGEYDKLLLDFYLVNCTLSADGFKVRATINGVQFTLTEWLPYVIEGLKAGECTIKLELLDKDNNLVTSPFNPVERKVNLQAAA